MSSEMRIRRSQLLCACCAMLIFASACDRPPVTHSKPLAAPEPTPASANPHPATPASADASDADVAAAVNVIIDYYAAINERDYQRAYRHWGQNGAASGRSFDDFAAGFRDTANVAVTPGTPGRVDPAAGSRYISIPVVVTAVTAQGREQRFAGTYNLRRAVVDGATEAQRRWHFYSAALKQSGSSP